MNGPRPLVIAGAQRSASTSLAEHLGRHPSILMAPREVRGLEDPYYPAGLAPVLRHVRDAARGGLVAGMKRPELLHKREGAERVSRHLPGAVVVISLREPIARAVSAYGHYVRHGLLPSLPVEDGLGRLFERGAVRRPWHPGDQVLAYSCYADALRRFLGGPGPQPVVLFHEELSADAEGPVSEVVRRLGLEPADLGPFPTANARPARDRLGVDRLANRICYDMRPDLESIVVTSNVVRRGAGRGLRSISAVLPARRPAAESIGADLRRTLGERFGPDVAEVERLLGRPVPPSWRAALAW